MFDNRSIQRKVPRKPHICVRQGWWRVSPMPVRALRKLSFVATEAVRYRWDKAHQFAHRLNFKDRQG